ncbi:MAG: 1,4-dihydroxy-2-naphthoate polyprenyltransferase [candidate division KSB1 bacterium]|nr:1,4-dihydroxy-2-naphthoate polyprenyltransferase [candidate division KSB1 bacterium]
MNLKPWLLAARPKTLPAAIAPVLIGTALAYRDGRAHPLAALLAGACALLLQIGANYANDYFDYRHGSDKAERLGPTRAVAAGWIKPEQMRNGFLVVFSAAAVCGAYLVVRGGVPAIIIGALSILCAVLYTGGPYPLGYHGLGELFVFIFFGFAAVAGTYYVQALTVTPNVLLAAVGPGLLSTAILTVNNLRDIDDDRASGKLTLPVRWGAAFGRGEYLCCVIVAVLVIPLLLVLTGQVKPTALLAVAAFAEAIPPLRILLREPPSRKYNEALAQTGRLLLIYSLLFSIGILV